MIPYTQYKYDGNVTAYPVNYMRNQALLMVQTELVVLIDGDFLPSDGLYDRFAPSSPSYTRDVEAMHNDRVFVVPCFMQTQKWVDHPHNKTALVGDDRLGPPYDPPGRPHHHLTDYTRWTNANADYDIAYRFFYEPYVVQSMRRAPFWDERFVYYGFDKVVYHYTLDRLGARYTVLHDQFVMHLPHPRDAWYESDGKKASDDAAVLHKLVDSVLSEWGDTQNRDWRLAGQEEAEK